MHIFRLFENYDWAAPGPVCFRTNRKKQKLRPARASIQPALLHRLWGRRIMHTVFPTSARLAGRLNSSNIQVIYARDWR